MRPRDTFHAVHLAGLGIVAIGMAWGEFLMSVGQLVLVGGWIAEGVVRRDLPARLRRAFTSTPSLVFISFWLLHLLGLLWTSDMQWGLDICRILLPVFVLGVVLSSSRPLEEKELRSLMLLFAAATVASTFACLVLRPEGGDFRANSVLISHIRLALMLCMSVFVLAYYWPRSLPWQGLHAVLLGWGILYIVLLESIGGIGILLVVCACAVWWVSRRWKPSLRWRARAAFALVPLAIAAYLWTCVREFHHVEAIDLTHLDERTAGGESYYHDRERPGREGGHYVWVYVANGELERGWERRSTLDYAGADAKGQPLHWTLVRYLASLGLRKDSLGIAQLAEVDVERIEQGFTSVRDGRRNPLRSRIDEVLFEMDQYRSTGDASGHSVAMRLEFWKVGLSLVREHWLTGVGTGDTRQAFNTQYERMDTRLRPRWRLRAHNEYLTLCITFGVLGFAWSLFSWIWPAWRTGAWRHPLFLAWGLTFLVSCLTEDTIETQAGATFFAFFYTVFVFAAPRPRPGREASPASSSTD